MFSVFGRASGSLLIGCSKLKLRETNDSGAEVVAAVSDRSQQQSIPVTEACLGDELDPSDRQAGGV